MDTKQYRKLAETLVAAELHLKGNENLKESYPAESAYLYQKAVAEQAVARLRAELHEASQELSGTEIYQCLFADGRKTSCGA